jgi:hypothetical protein
MNVDLRYWGKSGTRDVGGGAHALSFAPNLARPKVFFDQQLKSPLRFREAISALHDVVVGDFKFRAKDKTAYRAWLAEQKKQEDAVRRAIHDQAYKSELQALAKEPVAPNLEADFRRYHDVYWRARRKWASDLQRNDPELFRSLVPCDPVVTVAPDVVFFECFAKDESSYGCLFVDRDAFIGVSDAGLGTTNVDYSLALYDHFQTLRTYRPTRLMVDPTGFQVDVRGGDSYREEKIDLPPSWLRGFGQLQGAMMLASRRVELSVDAVYSLLAYLKRHREKTGPRAVRFELCPGQAPTLVLEPWNVELPSHGAPYQGAAKESVKVWGRRRLQVLHRLLPLTERVEVQLLGSGMPSIWTLHLGDMRFVLALSGWTQNDWTSGAALELLAGELAPDPAVEARLEQHLTREKSATLSALEGLAQAPRASVLGSLHQLCKHGQAVYDFATGLYRYRPVMPIALSEAVLGPEPEEVREGKRLARGGKLQLTREEPLGKGRTLLQGLLDKLECEAIVDVDGGFTNAKCKCSHFYKFRLRAGPCRHLLALRLHARGAAQPRSLLKTWLN